MDPNRIIQALKGTIDPNLRIAAETELNQVRRGRHLLCIRVTGRGLLVGSAPRPWSRPGLSFGRGLWGKRVTGPQEESS